MTVCSASDSALTRAAAHLDAAIFLAMDRARLDADELISPWANTANTITCASMALTPYLDGLVQAPEHPDCRTALLAATEELARLRPDVDAPLGDLVLVMEFLVPALQHVHADVTAQAQSGQSGQSRPA